MLNGLRRKLRCRYHGRYLKEYCFLASYARKRTNVPTCRNFCAASIKAPLLKAAVLGTDEPKSELEPSWQLWSARPPRILFSASRRHCDRSLYAIEVREPRTTLPYKFTELFELYQSWQSNALCTDFGGSCWWLAVPAAFKSHSIASRLFII